MNYRPEIDGLRTLAVIPVLFFHFGINSFSGGFTGVDIFFVISGFLITSIITHEMDNQKFSFANFYRRRALRILPPLALVVVATFIAAWFLMLPAEVEELGRTTIATTLFGSNIYFFKAYNYFSILAESNPLLHTWSLAVEEQFYFVTPILLWLICFIKPLAKFRAHIIAFCVAVSFVLSLWLINWSSEAAFYLLPARFWELGIGSLIALYAWDQKFPGKLKNTAGIIGVGLLAYSIFMLDKTDMFPGLNAIYAVVGTALIIVAGLKSWTGLVLSQKPMVFIGKISYSLYLWHWPVLIFYKLIVFKTELNWVDVTIVTLLSFALAFISWKYWETPFRHMKAVSAKKTLSYTCAGLVVFAGVGVLSLSMNGQLRSFDNHTQELTNFTTNYTNTSAYRSQFRPRDPSCYVTDESLANNGTYNWHSCITPQTNKPTLLMIGDSHSAHIAGSIASNFPNHETLQLQASGCLPLWPLKGEARCTDLLYEAIENYISSLQNTTVIISARWTIWGQKPEKEFEITLHNFIQKLTDAGVKRVIVLGPSPELTSNLPFLMARAQIMKKNDLSPFINHDVNRFDSIMKRTLSQYSTNVEYISLVKQVCLTFECNKEIPQLFDDNHVTADVSIKVSQFIKKEMLNHQNKKSL